MRDWERHELIRGILVLSSYDEDFLLFFNLYLTLVPLLTYLIPQRATSPLSVVLRSPIDAQQTTVSTEPPPYPPRCYGEKKERGQLLPYERHRAALRFCPRCCSPDDLAALGTPDPLHFSLPPSSSAPVCASDPDSAREMRTDRGASNTVSLGSWCRCPGTRTRRSGGSPASSPCSPTVY